MIEMSPENAAENPSLNLEEVLEAPLVALLEPPWDNSRRYPRSARKEEYEQTSKGRLVRKGSLLALMQSRTTSLKKDLPSQRETVILFVDHLLEDSALEHCEECI